MIVVESRPVSLQGFMGCNPTIGGALKPLSGFPKNSLKSNDGPEGQFGEVPSLDQRLHDRIVFALGQAEENRDLTVNTRGNPGSAAGGRNRIRR